MPGQTIGVSVFTARLSESLGLSAMQLSVAYMLGSLASAGFINSGGRFFDRFGARRAIVYSVFALGLVLIGLSFVEHFSRWVARIPLLNTRAWLPPFLVLIIGFALLRFTGQGMLTLSSRAMLGKWFNRRRGTVTAWSGAVVAFVFSGAPLALESLIRQFGWQETWRFLGGFLILVLGLLFWLFARDNPEECGLKMDGAFVGKVRKANLDSIIYPRFFGRKHLGAISGLFMTVIMITSAVGPFLFSLMVALFGSYQSGFGIAALAAALIALASLRADNPQRRLAAG